jgi:hypothetical protein
VDIDLRRSISFLLPLFSTNFQCNCAFIAVFLSRSRLVMRTIGDRQINYSISISDKAASVVTHVSVVISINICPNPLMEL